MLIESFIPMIDRNSVTKAYQTNLKKARKDQVDEYIDLESFLNVNCWYDVYLPMKRKDEVLFEEDKEEIDREISQIKELLFKLNCSSNGKLHIDGYIDTLLRLWPLV